MADEGAAAEALRRSEAEAALTLLRSESSATGFYREHIDSGSQPRASDMDVYGPDIDDIPAPCLESEDSSQDSRDTAPAPYLESDMETPAAPALYVEASDMEAVPRDPFNQLMRILPCGFDIRVSHNERKMVTLRSVTVRELERRPADLSCPLGRACATVLAGFLAVNAREGRRQHKYADDIREALYSLATPQGIRYLRETNPDPPAKAPLPSRRHSDSEHISNTLQLKHAAKTPGGGGGAPPSRRYAGPSYGEGGYSGRSGKAPAAPGSAAGGHGQSSSRRSKRRAEEAHAPEADDEAMEAAIEAEVQRRLAFRLAELGRGFEARVNEEVERRVECTLDRRAQAQEGEQQAGHHRSTRVLALSLLPPSPSPEQEQAAMRQARAIVLEQEASARAAEAARAARAAEEAEMAAAAARMEAVSRDAAAVAHG